MSQTVIITIAVIFVIALLLLVVLRSRKQRVTFSDAVAPPRPVAAPRPAATAPPAVAEGHGVPSEMTAAVEDMVDQFVGVEEHPSGRQPEPAGYEAPADTLTLIKGLGPKAESRLAELGVTHFAQIASWDAKEVETIDAQMGPFKGRILRDRWVEQAQLLVAGDTAGFEEKFGKLGG